jgi:hypothetical protein
MIDPKPKRYSSIYKYLTSNKVTNDHARYPARVSPDRKRETAVDETFLLLWRHILLRELPP